MRARYIVIFMMFVFTAFFSGCQRKSDDLNIGVTKAEVDEHLEDRINYLISLYGSKENMEKAAGKKMAEIKEEQRKIITAQLISEKAQR